MSTAAPLARSNSFFGAIKNIVTAPFTWFGGSEDEFEDARGKRRRLQVVPEDTHMEDESVPSRAKRMRVDSPDRDAQPYLDPPRSAFAQPRRTSDLATSGTLRDITSSPRRTLRVTSTSNQAPRYRTLSPLPSVPQLSPRRLKVRSSLTPQPSGTGFGPVVPPRRERGPDEPPPLTTLMSNPMFVKPPPGVQKQGAADPPKQLTLGTLIDTQRITRAPSRQSSILFGTGSMTDVSAPGHSWPVNKAEIALHELEVYKTPLLPTRLKGASVVPDMFLHKERKHITLMTDDRPAKPRLGTKSKGKEKGKGKKKEREITNGTKPYAGEGGMKKWLARRKKEEEETGAEREEEEKKKLEEELNVPPPPPAPVFEPRAAREGSLGSSLRVGRTRIGRNHIERPVSRRTKYSAAFEDEDEDMEDSRAAEHKALEEAAMKAPAFELPADFTFAKETTIAHDLTHAKEPPISSLPFSLTKPAVPSVPAPVLPAAETAKSAPFLVPPTPAPALPTISLVPPTPETVKVATEVPSLPAIAAPSAGIPNFFAKPAASTSPSFLSVPAVGQSKRPEVPEVPKAADVAPSSPFGPASRSASVFAAPTSDFPPASSTFGGLPTLSKEAEKPTTTVPTFTFGASEKPVEAGPAPTLSLPSEQPPVVEPAKSASSSDAPFSFGAPPSAPSSAAPAIPTPVTPAATVEAPKSGFTFGQPASAIVPAPALAPVVVPPAAEPPKFLFGTPPPATPFSFGPRHSTAPAEEKASTSLFPSDPSSTAEKKPATSPFSFETPSAAEKKPAASPFSFETSSTAEKKPVPSPFSFEASSTAEKKPAASPFSFDASSTEKKTTTGFTFGPSTASTAPTTTSATFSFGTPSGSAADVSSKPFTFGSPAPARPATPPKAAQEEVTMDESPTREMVLNGSGKAPERPTLSFSFNTPAGSALFAQSPATATTPFSFGASGTSVNPFAKDEKKETKPGVSFGGFGQPSSTGFSFGQKPPESPATTTTFQFTQPSPSVAPPSPFSFGNAPTSANPFGQPSAVSAPSSPSTFNRPASFGFGAPTTTQPAASPFTFGAGSQPASPATASTTLPSGTTGSTPFTFGAGANAAAGFGAASAAAPAGGSLFTMGSAPPPAEGAGGRRIKGLPRRGAARR